MPVLPKARYLGLVLGPGASPMDQWAGPLGELRRRVGLLAHAKWAP